jgi:hypothetical protein
LLATAGDHAACERRQSQLIEQRFAHCGRKCGPGERGISLLDDTLRVAAGGDKTRARRSRSNGSQSLRGNPRPIAASPTQRGFADIIVFLASDHAGFIAVAA